MRIAAMKGVDPLSEKASTMKESLQKSQTITDKVVTILGSFDHRLSALETAMRPTYVFKFLPFHFLFLFSSIKSANNIWVEFKFTFSYLLWRNFCFCMFFKRFLISSFLLSFLFFLNKIC